MFNDHRPILLGLDDPYPWAVDGVRVSVHQVHLYCANDLGWVGYDLVVVIGSFGGVFGDSAELSCDVDEDDLHMGECS